MIAKVYFASLSFCPSYQTITIIGSNDFVHNLWKFDEELTFQMCNNFEKSKKS